MTSSDLQVGNKVWYLFTALGDRMTHQEQVVVLQVGDERSKIKRANGKSVWVKNKNLRPTP
jgi:hypothetical protein